MYQACHTSTQLSILNLYVAMQIYIVAAFVDILMYAITPVVP